MCFAAFHSEHRPLALVTEKGTNRYLQYVVTGPFNHADNDPVAMTKSFPCFLGLNEVYDHIDPLLLDAERGYLGKTKGFYALDFALQRLGAAPVIDQDFAAGFNLDRIAGKQVCNNLDIRGITDFYNRRAGSNRRFAFMDPAQQGPAFR